MSPLPRRSSDRKPVPAVRHEECWAKTTPYGKPGISVVQHCRAAGIVAGLLAKQRPAWLAETLSIRSGVVLAALHDVGKVSPGFQSKCPAWLQHHGITAAACLGHETDHAKISQKTLQDLLPSSRLRCLWAAIVGAHHGTLKGDHLARLVDGGEAWSAERRRLVAELVSEFGELPDRPPRDFNCATLWFNAGLIAVADWLSSDEHTFPPSEVLDDAGIRERAEHQLERVGLAPAVCASGRTFAGLFPSLASPHPLQALLAQSVNRPGVYVIEASMGSGKTEAALLAAYNLLATGQATGIYFALPTQVTSNRIHERVEGFIRTFSTGSTRLIHGSSWLMDAEPTVADSRNADTGTRTGRDWFASPRRALLAPFGVGTVDQALLAIVAAKHFFVRQFGLAGKVVILDEVHSYDLYTGTLLNLLVLRLRELGATVIILSATLTAARRQELLGLEEYGSPALVNDYPLLSINVGGELLQQAVTSDQSKTIKVGFKSPSGLVDAVLQRADRGECVLWIRNTVHDAQDTYRCLRSENRVDGPEIGLLHARYPQFRRAQLEKDWLERLGKDEDHSRRPTNGCVLVSTQVAEQSVDIDADLLVTDLAPTDMLLQRIGRLWRHPHLRPAGCIAEAWIASPALDDAALRTGTAADIKAAFGRSARVYAPYVLIRTFALWWARTELALPGDIRPILEATYADLADEPPSWRRLRDDLNARKAALRKMALANATPWQVQLNDEGGMQTRWNSYPTVAVLLVRKVARRDSRTTHLALLNGDCCQLRDDSFDYTAAKAIHRNLVKVPRWSVERHLGSTPSWLGDYVAEPTLTCELCDGRLVLLDDRGDTGLTYRDDLGVVIPPPRPGRTIERTEEDDSESYD